MNFIKRKSVSVFFYLLTAFIILPGVDSSQTIAQSRLSLKDKRSIVKQIFQDGFLKLMTSKSFTQCTIPLADERKIILIETTTPAIFPKAFGEYRFIFMSSAQIEREIKNNNGDCFFRLSYFRVNKAKHVSVELLRTVAGIFVFKGDLRQQTRWISGESLIYEAEKKKGRWVVKFLNKSLLSS